jgi:hypothetical protein
VKDTQIVLIPGVPARQPPRSGSSANSIGCPFSSDVPSTHALRSMSSQSRSGGGKANGVGESLDSRIQSLGYKFGPAYGKLKISTVRAGENDCSLYRLNQLLTKHLYKWAEKLSSISLILFGDSPEGRSRNRLRGVNNCLMAAYWV